MLKTLTIKIDLKTFLIIPHLLCLKIPVSHNWLDKNPPTSNAHLAKVFLTFLPLFAKMAPISVKGGEKE